MFFIKSEAERAILNQALKDYLHSKYHLPGQPFSDTVDHPSSLFCSDLIRERANNIAQAVRLQPVPVKGHRYFRSVLRPRKEKEGAHWSWDEVIKNNDAYHLMAEIITKAKWVSMGYAGGFACNIYSSGRSIYWAVSEDMTKKAIVKEVMLYSIVLVLIMSAIIAFGMLLVQFFQ